MRTAHYESVGQALSDERGLSLEEKLFSEQDDLQLEKLALGSLGQSTAARVVGGSGPHEIRGI